MVGMKPYSEEFKADAVALYLSDAKWTYAAVGRDLGVNPETLRLWVCQARAEGTADTPVEGRPARPARKIGGPLSSRGVLEEENKQLKARVAELELERDILRRAAKYFAGETRW
jgi:transposase